MFMIKDISFDVQKCYLEAFINYEHKCLSFGICITAKKSSDDTKNPFDEYDKFSFQSDELFLIYPNQITHWNDISGTMIQWDNLANEDEESPALFYAFEHEPVKKADIKFESRNGKLFVKINALCDIYYDDEFYDNLPLQIESEIDFYGIFFGKGATEQFCQKEIEQFLDNDLLKFYQNKYGVSVLVPKDTDMQKNVLVLGDY